MSIRLGGRILLLTSVAVLAVACATKEEPKDEMGMASAAPAATMTDRGAEYTLVFKSTWSAASHPFEFPPAAAIGGPHFSGVVGASHNASFTLFKEGAVPTPGLERLSEEGKPSPLDEEIRAAVNAGTAGQLVTSGPLRDLKDSLVATVRVDPAHAMVSVVAMIAPSPDWFAGIADVNLMEGGQWATSRTVQLYAWDSGGDDGATYKASDKDNNPKKPTTKAMSRHFVTSGSAVPVATVTFTKK